MDNDKLNQAISAAKGGTSATAGTGVNSTDNTNNKLTAKDWLITLAVIGGIWALFAINHKSYEEYDLKGLTVVEACKKAEKAGWKIDEVRQYDHSDKTDCHNKDIIVTDYIYKDKKAIIVYGGKDIDNIQYSYEEYDLKGLTVAEACEKARSAGWKAGSIHDANDASNKTDCYNTSVEVSNYSYDHWYKTVEILFGRKKTEEEKEAEREAECKAQGKVYRSGGSCKSAEEWAAQDKKEAEEAKAAAEAKKQQSSTPSSSSGSSSSSSSSTTSIDPSKSYLIATIKAGEKCPSNVKFCNIPNTSSGYSNYGYGYMRGQIINNTGKDYSYLQVTAEVYNSAGAKIGDCWGNSAGLKAGATWQYEAYCNAWAPGVTFKNGDISGW